MKKKTLCAQTFVALDNILNYTFTFDVLGNNFFMCTNVTSGIQHKIFFRMPVWYNCLFQVAFPAVGIRLSDLYERFLPIVISYIQTCM